MTDWTFDVIIDFKPKSLDTNIDLTVAGGAANVKIALDLRDNASKTAKYTGGVSFECRRSPVVEASTQGACYCEMSNLKRSQISETNTKIDAELLKRDIPPAISGIPGISYKLTQPVVRITSEDMQITATNGGKCYNVFIELKAEFDPGSIEVTLPSLQIPGTPIKIPLDATATVGKPSVSRVRAEYRICCCEYDDNAKQYNSRNDGDLTPSGDYVIRTAGKCKFDYYCENLSFEVTGDTSILALSITALEGPCAFEIRQAKNAAVPVKVPGIAKSHVSHPKP